MAADLAEIGDASLTPGDPLPAGRCPVCDALAYVDKPDAAELADMLERLLGAAEMNMDSMEPTTRALIEEAGRMLASAK